MGGIARAELRVSWWTVEPFDPRGFSVGDGPTCASKGRFRDSHCSPRIALSTFSDSGKRKNRIHTNLYCYIVCFVVASFVLTSFSYTETARKGPNEEEETEHKTVKCTTCSCPVLLSRGGN